MTFLNLVQNYLKEKYNSYTEIKRSMHFKVYYVYNNHSNNLLTTSTVYKYIACACSDDGFTEFFFACTLFTRN